MPNSEQETKNNSKDKKIKVICWIIYSFLGVSVLFAILMAFVFCYWDTLEHSGLFGDTFGSINAFFSALAFAGVIVAILLQRKELEYQREELEQTRKEFQKQTEEFEEQNRTLSIQRFENTFFNMLNLLSSITNGMFYKKTIYGSVGGFNASIVVYQQPPSKLIEIHGRDVFVYFSKLLQDELISPQPTASLEIKIQNFIFNPPMEANIQLGYYFKTVYSILKFIETTQTLNLAGKRKYASMLRAQLSNDELFLLLCNSAYYKEFIPFKLLLEKYSMLKHFYLRTDIALTIGTPLRQEYQPCAFDKNGAFDISLYNSQLETMGIQNFVTEN